MSVIVASSTRKARAAGACAMSVRENARRIADWTNVRILIGSAEKGERGLVHPRVRRTGRSRLVRGVEGGNDRGARGGIEEEKRPEAGLTASVSDDRRWPAMDDEEREGHRIRRGGSLAHRMQRSPHARQRRALNDDVISAAARIVM